MNFFKRLDFSLKMLGMFALWLFGHPYPGLYHDARLYNLQALSHLYPEIYKRDLFLAYGSQDKFSIFSSFYAAAIDYLGLNNAVLALTFVGQMLWFSCTAFLLTRLLKGFSYWLALWLIVLLPGFYSSVLLLSYGEPFLTPRIYAESFALLAVAYAINNPTTFNWKTPFLLLLTLAIHPLMASGVVFLLLVYYGSSYWQWLKQRLVILIAICLLLSAILLQIEPFSRILQIMDEQWFQLVLRRTPFTFITKWDTFFLMPIVVNLSVLLIAWQSAPIPLKRLILAVIVTSITGAAISIIGGDFFHNVLIIQAQPWRWFWILQWFTYASFAWFLGSYWQHSQAAKAVIIVVVCAWFMRVHAGALTAPVAVVVWFWVIKTDYKQALPRMAWIGLGLLVLQTLVWFVFDIVFYVQITNAYYEGNNWFHAFRNVGMGVLLLPLFLVANLNITKKLLSAYPWLVLLNVACLLLVLLNWQNDIKKGGFPASEKRLEEYSEFRQLIPEHAIVYWEGNNALSVWMLLGRASYISETQTAGIVFNRETAIEALRRTENILPLSPHEHATVLDMNSEFIPNPKLSTNLHDLTKVCQDPVLDFVVFAWQIKGAVEVAKLKKGIYLYDCAKLRQG